MKKKKIYKNNFKYFFRFMNSNIISISHFQVEKKFLFQNIFLIIYWVEVKGGGVVKK